MVEHWINSRDRSSADVDSRAAILTDDDDL